MLTTDDDILDFITAGLAIFTVKNRDTGNRATYRVEAHGEGDARTYTVMAFTGAKNHLKTSYTLMGTLDEDGNWTARTAMSELDALEAEIARAPRGHWVDNKPSFLGRVRRTLAAGHDLSKNMAYRYNAAVRKYKVGGFITDRVRLVVFPWTWSRLVSGVGLPERIEVWHEGCCRYCSKRLTVPASIELGMGPDCAEEHGRYGDWKTLDTLLGRNLEAYAAKLAKDAA
jgi:hypothetical protein